MLFNSFWLCQEWQVCLSLQLFSTLSELSQLSLKLYWALSQVHTSSDSQCLKYYSVLLNYSEKRPDAELVCGVSVTCLTRARGITKFWALSPAVSGSSHKLFQYAPYSLFVGSNRSSRSGWVCLKKCLSWSLNHLIFKLAVFTLSLDSTLPALLASSL